MILGVDPGLAHVGWALLERGELVDRGVVETARDARARGDAVRRLAEVGAALHSLIFRAALVVVEWPGGVGGKNGRAALQTSTTAGMVSGLAWGSGRKVRAPAPVTWRAALGHQRGKDEQLHCELVQRYSSNLVGLRQGDLPHVLDAIGLALFGELVTNRSARPPAQLELVPRGT